MIAAIYLSGILISLLSLIQSIEFFINRAVTAEDGIWQWHDLRQDFSANPILEFGLSCLIGNKSFQWLNALRAGLAIIYFIQPNSLSTLGLLIIHILTLLRWRGTYNGGSDYMCLMILLVLSLAHFGANSNLILLGTLWYIAIQLCTSYFRAGWVKLNNPLWRSGIALGEFLQSDNYEPNGLINILVNKKLWLKLSAWSVIVYEVTFPLSLINTNVCLAYITLGILFHLGNVFFFGLNRFFWAWLAAYPALYYCASI